MGCLLFRPLPDIISSGVLLDSRLDCFWWLAQTFDQLPLENILMSSTVFHSPDVAIIYPQDPVLRMGSNLTASCWVHPDLGIHASSLFWTLNGQQVSSSLYRVLSPTNLSVTLAGLNASRQTSGDNLVCHNHKGHILAGSCLYVGSKLTSKMSNLKTI